MGLPKSHAEAVDKPVNSVCSRLVVDQNQSRRYRLVLLCIRVHYKRPVVDLGHPPDLDFTLRALSPLHLSHPAQHLSMPFGRQESRCHHHLRLP